MTFKPFVTALVLAGAVATTASAKTYRCEINPGNKAEWIPEIVVLDHNESTGQVIVLDPIIKHFKDGPITGEVTTDNNRRTTFKWVLKDITVTGGGQRHFVKGFRFTLTVQKASLQADVSSTPIGYANRDHGKGRCVVE